MRGRSFTALALALALSGCDANPSEDGGGRDGGPGGTDAPGADVPGLDTPALDAAGLDAPGADAPGTDAPLPDGGTAALSLPPENAPLDYQLGGPYAPPAGVMIVSRDRTAPPAPGLYNICYVNGFQIQPGEESFFMSDHPTLVLRDAGGRPVIDPDWDEILIDTSTPERRTELGILVGEWIDGCAAAGFDAVEIDNLDTFSRSGGRLTENDNVATMRIFADRAHAAGLAIAQKNSAEIVSRRAEMGTDFVVSEECNRYSECDVYTAVYGNAVLVIEYRRTDFTAGCAAFPELSIVLRDVNLVTPGAAAYVYDGC